MALLMRSFHVEPLHLLAACIRSAMGDEVIFDTRPQ